MEYEKAIRAIKGASLVGFAQAGIITVAAITVLITGAQLLHLDASSFVSIAILFGLAFGVYKKSRTCAVLLLLFYLLGLISNWQIVGGVMGIPVALLFCYFYVQGIRGTFAYHKHVKPQNAVRKKHSGYGIASFVLAITLLGILSLILFYLVALEPGPPEKAFSGLLILITAVLGPLGLILGIVGLKKKQHSKLFSICGVIVSGLFCLFWIVFLVDNSIRALLN